MSRDYSKVLISTPIRGNQTVTLYTAGMLQAAGLHGGWLPMAGQSDIYVARNVLANEFLRRKEFDTMIFIDSDIGFTRQHLQALIDTAKTVTAERDKIKTDFDYLIQGVQGTGATPAQYGETLSWLALFNSRDPAQQEKALELVESVAERLATLLGKERVVGDPLGAHPDLKDAVTKGQITAQYAKEIARTRNGQQFRTELQTGAQNEQDRQAQAQREEAQGRNDLAQLEQTLMASDPQYAQKKALLVPALKPIMAQIPWSQKAAKFAEAYRALQLPSAAARPATSNPKNQPLRPKNPAGGQAKAPSSMLEAISGALGSMGK